MSTKLSARTLSLLSNFASISPSIVLQPGKVLRTVSDSFTIIAMADIEEDFPIEFPILDVTKLLAVLKLKNFKECELEFEEKKLSLKGDKVSLTYWASAKELTTPPPSDIVLENICFQAEIKAEELTEFTRACSVLGHKTANLKIVGGKTFIVGTTPELGEGSNDYCSELGESELADCVFALDVSNMKMIDGNYIIKASTETQVASFESQDGTLKYYVGMQTTA